MKNVIKDVYDCETIVVNCDDNGFVKIYEHCMCLM